MQLRNPDLSGRRWQADFRRGRSWRGGRWAGSPLSLLACTRAQASTAQDFDNTRLPFAPNVLRQTTRGLFGSPATTQRLSNANFDGAVLGRVGAGGQLPRNMRVSDGAVVDVIEVSTVNRVRSIVLDIAYTNTNPIDPLDADAGDTIAISFEPGNGYLLPALVPHTFSGEVTVISATNVSRVSARLIERNASSALSGDSLATAVVAEPGVPTPFVVTPALDPSTVTIMPTVTSAVANASSGNYRVRISGVLLEESSAPTEWVGSSAGVIIRTDYYPYDTSTGAAVGGSLPAGWSLAAATTHQVIARNSRVANDITLRITVTNTTPALISGVLRLMPITAGGNVTAAAGEEWSAGIDAEVLSDTGGASPSIGIVGRNSGGGIAGSLSSPLAAGFGPSSVTLTMPAGTAYVTNQVSFRAAANSTSVCEIYIAPKPRIEKVQLVGATGPVSRGPEVISVTDPSIFAGAAHAAIDAEYRALASNATLLAVLFGSGHRLRLVAGARVGAVIELGGAVVADLTRGHCGAEGAIKLVVSWQAGSVTVALPDLGGSTTRTATIAGFDPTTVTGAWLCSANGEFASATAIRSLDVTAGALPAANLPQRARRRWAPINFRSPIGTSFIGNIADVPAFEGPSLRVVGTSYSSYPANTTNRFFRRRNGGAAMADIIPDATTAPTLALLTLINEDAVASLSLVPAGGSIEGGSPLVLPPLSSVTFCASEGIWIARIKPGDPFKPAPIDVPTVSIYGPAGDPTRSIVHPPSYADYHAIIDPVRAFASECVKQANLWVTTGNRQAALKVIAWQRQWCGQDYWRGPAGDLNSLAQRANQIAASGMAYLIVRDSGIGSAEDHAIIRAWFLRATTEMVEYYAAIRGQGFIAPQVWTGTNTGRNNHSYAAGWAAITAARICGRAEWLRFGREAFDIALTDAATLPGATGSLIAELSRGTKALYYSNYALVFLIPLSIALKSFGVDIWNEQGRMLLRMVNFVMPAIDLPELVEIEQARLIGLGNTGTSNNLVSVPQEGIGFTSVDDVTGELNPNESRVSHSSHAIDEFEEIDIPWKPIWVPRVVDVYINQYNTNSGGGQRDLFPKAAA
ncbi:alginate lyase family protein [Nevskia sp.]|uniref:alginate lyase family protein n=1 Tax=Nevskia sp. TaxID=1929292 RepID=UPI0025D54967|nr:alginate lyase family protein [Nevskia sp.]